MIYTHTYVCAYIIQADIFTYTVYLCIYNVNGVYLYTIYVCVLDILCSKCVCLCKRDTHLVTAAPCWCPPAASCACGWPCWSSIPPARQWSPSPLRTTCCSRSSPHAPPQRAACVCWPLSACVSHAAKLGRVAACQQPQAVKVIMKVHQRPTEYFRMCIL